MNELEVYNEDILLSLYTKSNRMVSKLVSVIEHPLNEKYMIELKDILISFNSDLLIMDKFISTDDKFKNSILIDSISANINKFKKIIISNDIPLDIDNIYSCKYNNKGR